MKVRIKKTHPNASLPAYATDGAMAFDLKAAAVNGSDVFGARVDRKTVVDIGLAFEIPKGMGMLVFSRSGHGFKNAVRLANCVGLIDSDYRGSVQVALQPDSENTGLFVSPGDRIAQALILPIPEIEFELVAELSETDRGARGFGSTGA